MLRRALFLAFALFLSGFALTACDSPEEKETKYIQRGNILFERAEYEKARVEYKNAARINPTSAEARYRLGLVEEATGNIRAAFMAFLAAEQQDQAHADSLLKLAQYYLVGDQHEQSIKRLDSVLAKNPNNAQAHGLKAALFFRQKDFDKATQAAATALEKDAANVTAFTVLTGLALEKKEQTKAEATVEEAIARNPKDLSLLLLKAMVYENAGNLDKVSEAYRAVFRLKPEIVRFRSDLAELYLKAGQKEEAEKVLRQGVAELQDSVDMKRKLIDFLSTTQGLEAAEREIRQNVPKDQEIFWLADLYIKHKDMDRAIALLEEMVAQDGGKTEGSLNNARSSLARLHFVKGNKTLAQKLVDLVLEKESNNAEALFLRANLSFEQGLYQNAVSDLRTIVRDNPRSSNALQLLAETLLVQGHLDLAIDTLNQLVTADPANKTAQIRLAQFFGLKGEPKRALALLEIITKSYPDLAVGWESAARIAIEIKDWKTAEESVRKLETLEGQKPTALFLRGQIDSLNGRHAEAMARYKEVISPAPLSPLAEHALSSLIKEAKNADELKNVTDFIAGIQNPSAYITTLLGECYATLGKTSQAATAFDEAIERHPPFQEPYIGRARLFMGEKKKDEALAVLKKGREAVSADLRASMMAADILGAGGQYKEAVKLYEDVLARNPKADIAANNLAQLIADYQENDSAALEKARLAAERFISATNPLFLDTLAWVYFKQGHVAQARTIMERVMAFGDKLPAQIFYHHGAILAKLGQTEEAKQALQKALANGSAYAGKTEAQKLLESL